MLSADRHAAQDGARWFVECKKPSWLAPNNACSVHSGVGLSRLHTPEQPAPIDAVKRSAKTVALSELQAANAPGKLLAAIA